MTVPFSCFFYIQKGVDIHGKPLTSHAKGPHGTSERREFEPGCALVFEVTLLSHQERGASQQKIRLGLGGDFSGHHASKNLVLNCYLIGRVNRIQKKYCGLVEF